MPVRKVFHRPGDAAHAVRLQCAGGMALSKNQFGRTAANVHHEPAFIAVGQQVRNAQVNQAGFFATGDHFDRKAQNLAGLSEEYVTVSGFTQGLGGHGTHMRRAESGNALAKPGQAGPAALQGVFGQVAVGVKAVALAHGFFEVFHPPQVAVFEAANFKAKAVGAEVDGGEEVFGLHGVGGILRHALCDSNVTER